MQELEHMAGPNPALLARDGILTQRNEEARALFPGLKEGSSLPDSLLAPDEEAVWSGFVRLEGRHWNLSARREGEDTLYLLLPAAQSALSEGQLDSALYQLRTLMTRFHREIGPYVSGQKVMVEEADRAEFSRDYYRMLRLMDHLDLMRDAADGQLSPARSTFEVGAAIWRAVTECDGILREIGIGVTYQGVPGDLMVQGDPDLLRTALLELISNSARRLKAGGTVTVRLSKRGERALILVTDDGPAATARQRAAMTTRGGLPRIPTGDTGAGLGLSVAEEIVRVHGGALLISAGEGAPKVWLALPLSRAAAQGEVPVCTPERNAGMSPYLIGLADVLPGRVILEDWLE